MMPAREYRSSIAGSIHEMIRDVHDVGVVSYETLVVFEDRCLTQVPIPGCEEPARCEIGSTSPSRSSLHN